MPLNPCSIYPLFLVSFCPCSSRIWTIAMGFLTYFIRRDFSCSIISFLSKPLSNIFISVYWCHFGGLGDPLPVSSFFFFLSFLLLWVHQSAWVRVSTLLSFLGSFFFLKLLSLTYIFLSLIFLFLVLMFADFAATGGVIYYYYYYYYYY